MRHWNARKGPRMGPKVHEVDSARSANKALGRFAVSAGAQTKVDEVCFSESCQVCAVKVPANLTVFPKITQTVKKLPNSPTYHLMVPKLTELYRISPDHCRYHLMPPNERKTHA